PPTRADLLPDALRTDGTEQEHHGSRFEAETVVLPIIERVPHQRRIHDDDQTDYAYASQGRRAAATAPCSSTAAVDRENEEHEERVADRSERVADRKASGVSGESVRVVPAGRHGAQQHEAVEPIGVTRYRTTHASQLEDVVGRLGPDGVRRCLGTRDRI